MTVCGICFGVYAQFGIDFSCFLATVRVVRLLRQQHKILSHIHALCSHSIYLLLSKTNFKLKYKKQQQKRRRSTCAIVCVHAARKSDTQNNLISMNCCYCGVQLESQNYVLYECYMSQQLNQLEPRNGIDIQHNKTYTKQQPQQQQQQ